MSRPIKFRAWHKRWQRMYDWQQCQDDYTLYWLNSALMGEHVIMQYTGLKDKHGVEIYEGDILRTKNYGSQPPQIWEVVWDEQHWNAFCYKARNGIRNLLGAAMTVTRDMEVIGNIYENPELLK